MNAEQEARKAVREYLNRCPKFESAIKEEDWVEGWRYLIDFEGPFSQLIELAQEDRGAWFACLWLLNHTDETPAGEVGFVPDHKRLDPEFRASLQQWAYRALTGEIQAPPADRGPKTKPLNDHMVVMAVYKATLFGLPAYAGGNSTHLTACELVAEELGYKSSEAIISTWKKRPKPRSE